MKVSLIGAGWYGQALGWQLAQNGFEVCGTTRSTAKFPKLKQNQIEPFLLNYPEIPAAPLLQSEIIILNIPPFGGQLNWFKRWPWPESSWPIFISSTSVYGELGGAVDESVGPAPSTPAARELVATEEWIKQHFARWNIIRLGGLIGPDRHPGKSLSGRQEIAGGGEPVNLIHLDDAIGFTLKIIEQGVQREVFNLVSDEHSSRQDFYTEYTHRQGLPPPHFLAPSAAPKGKLVANDKVKQIYQLKRPTLIGR